MMKHRRLCAIHNKVCIKNTLQQKFNCLYYLLKLQKLLAGSGTHKIISPNYEFENTVSDCYNSLTCNFFVECVI